MLSAAFFDNKVFNTNAQDTAAKAVFFKPDGTKMYFTGQVNDRVYQCSLSTPWDISTATYESVSFLTTSQGSNPDGLFFKPNGTKMYVLSASSDRIFQYSLSTPWDISTTVYDSVSLNINPQDAGTGGMFFSPDGSKLFTTGTVGDAIFSYTLGTEWDLSTATYDSVSLSTSPQALDPTGVFCNSDGTKLYSCGSTNSRICEYSMSTPYDLSTASYNSVFLQVNGSVGHGMFIKPDDSKLYIIVNTNNDDIRQYSLP